MSIIKATRKNGSSLKIQSSRPSTIFPECPREPEKGKKTHDTPFTTLSRLVPRPEKGPKLEIIWATSSPKIFNPCIPGLCPLQTKRLNFSPVISPPSKGYPWEHPWLWPPHPSKSWPWEHKQCPPSLSPASNHPRTAFYRRPGVKAPWMRISELETEAPRLQHPAKKGCSPPRVSAGGITATNGARTHAGLGAFLVESPEHREKEGIKERKRGS